MLRTVFRSLALLLVVCTPVLAQDAKPEDVVVDQARGVDPQVDYAGLKALGPWDDRNY